MMLHPLRYWILPALIGLGLGMFGAWSYRDQLVFLNGWSTSSTNVSPQDDRSSASTSEQPTILELKTLARKNLGLTVKVARLKDHWRVITIPGVVRDRPGVSDRGVTSPAVGAVSAIHVFPGDTVVPGDRLVTIQLFSEYLQATQTGLFQASSEIELIQSEIDRLSELAERGGTSKARMIQLQNDKKRQETLVRSSIQELLSRGLSPQQIDQTRQGQFVSSIEVVAPPSQSQSPDDAAPINYELQSLAVELGQTVQAGQLICSLADHSQLYIVGHAFKRESGWLEQAAQGERAIDVEFLDDDRREWPAREQTHYIRHLSNVIDPQSRTLDFFVPLRNESRSYEVDGESFRVWRFRPGQRTKIHVPIEKLTDVFVLPAEAVAYEGGQAFVYRQNGDLFNQISVHVRHKDRRHAVIASDGSITPGTYLAYNSGATLRRILKAQSASGQQPGVHVHADGTVHAAH
ncbi:MAG: efflux RND transporter periplasmic adaptor subunit [Planctomycetota bacterium]